MICPHCKKDNLELSAGDYPYSVEHLICPRCCSTYNIGELEVEEEKCETCKKWLRINNYKGFCSKDPDTDLEYTYEEDWCNDYVHWAKKDK